MKSEFTTSMSLQSIITALRQSQTLLAAQQNLPACTLSSKDHTCLIESLQNVKRQMEILKSAKTREDKRQNTKQFKHGCFGLMRQVSNPYAWNQDERELMILNIQVLKLELSKWRDRIEKIKKDLCKHKQILLPVGLDLINEESQENQCQISFRYPMYRNTLRSQIQNRRHKGQTFPEKKLEQILYHLMVIGTFFQPQKIKIGNVHPTNILVNEKGKFKVISTMYSLPGEKDNFSKVCESQLADVFLAPEQIDYQCFKRKEYPKHVDYNRAELFSIGMTLLEMASLESSTQAYDKDPYRLKYSVIKKHLAIVRERYTEKFYGIVESLVSVDSKDRMTFLKIAQLNPMGVLFHCLEQSL